MSEFGAPYYDGSEGSFDRPNEGIIKKIQKFYMGNGAADLTVASAFIGTAFLLYLIFSEVYAMVLGTNVYVNGFYFSSHMARICVEMLYSLLCVGLPFIIVYLIMTRSGLLDINIPCGRVRAGSRAFLLILGGIAICFMGNIVTNILVSVFASAGVEFSSFNRAVSETAQPPQNGAQLALMVLHTAVFPAVFEEFAFRGVMLQSLRKYGDWFAILSSAVFFGLIHGNMTQMPFAIIAGVALGYAVTVTGSLWTGVILHFCNNFISLAVSLVRASFPQNTAMAFSTVTIYGLIFIGAAALGFYIYMKPNFFRLYPSREKKVGKGKAVLLTLLSPPMVVAIIAMCFPVFEDMIFKR